VGDAASSPPPQHQTYDLIICDAPCSGSGTWSRTPEGMHYFSAEKIGTYAQLQKNIVRNVSRFLKPRGLLLYITCSVFKQENEDVIAFCSDLKNMAFLKSAYYKGYDKKADTLFAALFQAL
jgi:16S rRNA (cytosine967-C5)-methyltransferase